MATGKYYVGEAHNLGKVSPLGCQTFFDFAKDILGQPQVLNITREEFWMMSPKERDERKRVRFAIPATIDDTGIRRYEHAGACNLLALDIDINEEARRFHRSPQLLVELLNPFSWVAHTTAKSTEKAPRIRIYIDAEKIPIKKYRKALIYLGSLLDVTINKETKVSVQPMFLPTIFQGEDPMFTHPVFAEHLTGRAFLKEDIRDTETLEEPNVGRAEEETLDDGGYLEWLREPLGNVQRSDIIEALSFLNPDMDFHKWTEIAMALKHQFQKDPNVGYKIFDDWSAKGGSKYAGSDDTAAKWKNVSTFTRGRAPVTLKTLLHWAKEEGWANERISNQCYQDTLEWIESEERTEDHLIKQGSQRVANTTLITPLERDLLLSKLHAQMIKHEIKITRGELKKYVVGLVKSKQRKTQEKETKTVPEKQLPAWARGFVYVSQYNEFYLRSSDVRFKPESLDNTYNVFLTDPDAKNGMPDVTAKAFLLNIARIPRVHLERYDPAHPGEIIVQDGPVKFLNTYRASYPEPTHESKKVAGDLFYAHLVNLLSNKRERHLLIDWLAYHVQNPGGKIRWAVLLQGVEGCGKTIIADIMRLVLGKANVGIVDAYIIKNSQFNSWAYGAQICALEEIRIIGGSRYEVMNKLKPCITNDVVSIHKKNKDLFEIPNVTNYLMLTNYQDALAVHEGDRRYFVVYSDIQREQQVFDLGEEYFPNFYKMLASNASGLRARFEDWEISEEFNPNGHAPKTRHLETLKEASASPLAAAITQAVEDNAHPFVRSDILIVSYLREIILSEGTKAQDQYISAVLRERGWIKKGRWRVGGKKESVWIAPGTVINEEDIQGELDRRYEQIGEDFFDTPEDTSFLL